MRRSIEYERSREEDKLLEKFKYIMSDDGFEDIQDDLVCYSDMNYEEKGCERLRYDTALAQAKKAKAVIWKEFRKRKLETEDKYSSIEGIWKTSSPLHAAVSLGYLDVVKEMRQYSFATGTSDSLFLS